jgi:ectoine hydroxylase-related dioxygenase (phytanoyl-CoA dioxygenase family)
MRYTQDKAGWSIQVAELGCGITPTRFSKARLQSVFDALESLERQRSRAGIRHILKHPAVCDIANSKELLAVAASALGGNAVAFRATLFDKSPKSNWLVAWHQDTALPLRERRETDGWGPWSVKDDVIYAHAPAQTLEKVLALRLHLDDSDGDNGPLRILPGTHVLGVLTDQKIHELSEAIEPRECHAAAGSVIAMRPLVAHASSKSRSDAPRRVLHIEYAPSLLIEDGIELAVV